MDLFDLAPRERWQDLLAEVHERTGMTATLYNQSGDVVLRHERWPNTLCPLVQETPSARTTVCAVVQQVLGKQAAATGEPQLDECDLGMIKFVVPVEAGGEVVGTVGACGAREPDTEVETFLAAQILERSEEELTESAQSVPAVSSERVREAVAFLQRTLPTLTG